MVVLQPIRPGSARYSGVGVKRGRARRALSLLGTNDAKLNLQLAESLMTISTQDFTKKWNFDPIRAVPLARGRYNWVPATPNSAAPPLPNMTSEPLPSTATPALPHTCLTAPDLSQPQEPCDPQDTRDPCCPRTCSCVLHTQTEEIAHPHDHTTHDTPTVERDSGVDSSESTPSTPSTPSATPPTEEDSQPRLRQTCITEFVRPRKRLAFPAKEPQPQTSQSKKRSASSIQDSLQPPHKKVLLQLRA